MRFLICYDISDDKCRTRIAKRLKQMGMKRLQKSVFIGRLKKRHQTELHNTTLSLINTKKDKFYMIPLSLDLSSRIAQFGQQMNLEWLLCANIDSIFH